MGCPNVQAVYRDLHADCILPSLSLHEVWVFLQLETCEKGASNLGLICGYPWVQSNLTERPPPNKDPLRTKTWVSSIIKYWLVTKNILAEKVEIIKMIYFCGSKDKEMTEVNCSQKLFQNKNDLSENLIVEKNMPFFKKKFPRKTKPLLVYQFKYVQVIPLSDQYVQHS